MLHLAQLNDCVELITAFILELIDMTVNVHQNDYTFPPPCPIHGSYNPTLRNSLLLFTNRTSRAECQICKSTALLQRRIMMTTLWLMGNATKSTLVYHMVDMDTCSYGSVPFMGTHMVFISLIEVKEGKIPSHRFSNSRKKCQNTYFMTLHVGYQSMHWTEHHPCLPTQDSGMISFILWAMYVEITSNCVMLKDLRVWTLNICEQVNAYLQCIKYTGAQFIPRALYVLHPSSSCTYWTKRRQRSSGKMLM